MEDTLTTVLDDTVTSDRPSTETAGMKYIAPEIASVGDAPKAYLQRIVAVFITIACLVFAFDTLYSDCRMFKIYKHRKGRNNSNKIVLNGDDSHSDNGDAESNFSANVASVVNAFGDDSVPNFRIDSVDSDTWKKSEAVFVGVKSYAFVDYDDVSWLGTNHYQCRPFEWIETPDVAMPGHDQQRYYRAIRVLQTASPYFGVIGMVLACVELLFRNWYPTVVAGAGFLGLAGCCELAYIILYVVDLKPCFDTNQCRLFINFYTSLFVAGGFCFAATLVLTGIRTYPFFQRRNRDPVYCQSVDAEVVTVEEGRRRLSWANSESADLNSTSNHRSNNGYSQPSQPMTRMETRLGELKRLLDISQDETRTAVERARRAEAKLRAMAIDMKEKTTKSQHERQMKEAAERARASLAAAAAASGGGGSSRRNARSSLAGINLNVVLEEEVAAAAAAPSEQAPPPPTSSSSSSTAKSSDSKLRVRTKAINMNGTVTPIQS